MNVLRVADVPEILGLLAPRPLTIVSSDDREGAAAVLQKPVEVADLIAVIRKFYRP